MVLLLFEWQKNPFSEMIDKEPLHLCGIVDCQMTAMRRRAGGGGKGTKVEIRSVKSVINSFEKSFSSKS